MVVTDDTSVELRFAQGVDSQTARAGDTLHLTLAENLDSGSTVIAPKGTRAVAVVVHASPAKADGTPGCIVIRVQSLNPHRKTIPLYRIAALEGSVATGPSNGRAMGQEAAIAAGTALITTLCAGTIQATPAL
jgi:hypothetical protein